MGIAENGQPLGRRFTIVGMHAKPGRAVCHVGLLPRDQSLRIGEEIGVYEMRPPVQVDPGPQQSNRMQADVLAWLDDLTAAEVEGMEAWVERIRVHLRERTVGYRYQALPAYEEQLNEHGDRLLRRKFSCAGFVAQCYAAGADIVLVDEAALPAVEGRLLEQVWARREVWELVGLKGDGPWRVLLPGYLLHAARGGRSGLPYRPQASDHAL